MEEELKAVKNSLTRVADTLERIESSRSGPGMSNFFEWFEHLYFSDEYDLIYIIAFISFGGFSGAWR